MKKHGQICGLALASELVGDRWTLLIVRELLTGPKRFTSLRKMLPSLAPNLLTSRLRLMVSHGLILHLASNELSGANYQLTPLGLSLKESVYALTRWGGQFIPQQKGEQQSSPHWLLVALPALIEPKARDYSESFICHLDVGQFPITIEVNNRKVHVQQGKQGSADLKIRLSYKKCLALFSGYLKLNEFKACIDNSIEGSAASKKKLSHLLC